MLKHFRTFLFFALCFALGIGIAKTIQWWRHTPGPTITPPTTGFGRLTPFRGFALVPPPRPDLPPAALAASLTALHATHATAIAIHYPASANPQHLTRFVQALRATPNPQLPLILLPPQNPASGTLNPYPHPLPQIAAQAQSLGIDFLTVSWLTTDPDESYWRKQLALIRAAYKGNLILAASNDIIPGIEFWDAADHIGAFSKTWDLSSKADPTIHDLRSGWAGYLDTLESLARRHGKPLFLLDLAFAPTLPAHHAQAKSPPKNPAEAAAAFQLENYQALLLETKGRQNLDGLIFAHWDLTASIPAQDPLAPNAQPAILQAFTDTWVSEGTPPPPENHPPPTAPPDEDQ